MLPPEARLPKADLQRLIDQELYWVLHAPRQTGKTSFLMSWMRTLNASGQVVACYVSVERCQGMESVEMSMPAISEAIRHYARDFSVPVPDLPVETSSGSILTETVKQWAEFAPPSRWWSCSTRWTRFRGRP